MKEDFKNIIKQTVDNYSDSIDPDMIWAGVENKLGNKKKRFAGFWMFGGLCFVVTLLALVFFMYSGDSIDKLDKGNYAYANKKNQVEVENELIEETTLQSDVTVNSNDGINIEEKENTVDSALKGVEIINDEVVISKRESISNKVVDKQDIERAVDIMLVVDTEVREMGAQTIEAEDVASVNRNEMLDGGKARQLVSVTKLNFINGVEFPLVDRVVNDPEQDLFLFDSQTFRKTEKNFKFLSGIELYTGLSMGSKSVSDLDMTYAQVRDDSEKLLEQWNAGLRIDVANVLDFKFQSGIKYSMITDRLQVVNQYKDWNEYTYMKSRLVDDAIVVIDSMIVVDSTSQSSTYTVEQYNSQRIISIPLEVSFGKSFGKFDLGIGFGVDVNYQLADTHVILDQNERPSINRVGGKWVSPSFSGALLLGYSLSENWSLTSRANFRDLSLSDHESISSLKSNYKLYGLEIGLRRNFGR